MNMATNQPAGLMQRLRTLALSKGTAMLTDAELLGSFIDHHDQAAFAALVRRHGPMVWGVCRRLLNHHDAEDAFQATFLVLARKAAEILPREMVPNWLYGVAHQTALQARRTMARRRTRERQANIVPESPVVHQELWSDLEPVLDAEMSRLPDKYRVVIVLCDLEGKTRKEAARQLGCPEGTVAARLARGRAMLAKRLARHGFTIAGGALAVALAQNAAHASVPISVLGSALKTTSLSGVAKVTGSIAGSAKAIALAEGVIRYMFLTKLKGITLGVALTLSLGVGGTICTRTALGQNQAETKAPSERRQGSSTERTSAKIQRKRELDLRGRSDVRCVDLEKRLIMACELIGGDVDNRFVKHLTTVRVCEVKILGDLWRLSVTPTTEIVIDGKKSQLDDLKNVVEAVEPGHITVVGLWEFETLKPRHSTQDGRAKRIEVFGQVVDGVTHTIDAKKRTITLMKSSGNFVSLIPYEISKEAEVHVNGKTATFNDLKQGMQVFVQMSALKGQPVVSVTALGPQVEGIIRRVDARGNTITARIPNIQMTVENTPVAKDAKVIIDGRQGKLDDLQPGMLVTLQMCAEADRGVVVGITLRTSTGSK
jgi:RNA polymerase sigma factor (sigma-70 family)